MNFTEARQLFEQNEFIRALEILNDCISKDTASSQSLLLRGRIHYKMQNWGDAMNDYASVLELDPESTEAKTGLGMAKSILGYFTPDMFNP